MRERKESNYKAKPAFNGFLACMRGDATWQVVDLNIERKVVPCPSCGVLNDISEAIKRGRE